VLIVHIILVLGATHAVADGGIVVFYLIQERRLKSKKSPSLLEKLPPLGTLDDLISTSMDLASVHYWGIFGDGRTSNWALVG
jgi:ABC-type uncharacterized transport system permease subunit